MTTNELFWASAFGAALGVTGVTALLGILSWAWRRAALWWVDRKIRQGFVEAYAKGLGMDPPSPPYPTPEAIKEMVRAMGGPPLQGAVAGIEGDYDGPARPVGTVVGVEDRPGHSLFPFPGVLKRVSLDNGVEGFVVYAEWAKGAACPCCWQKGEALNKTFSKEFLKALEPPSGPGGGFPIPEDLPPPTSAS